MSDRQRFSVSNQLTIKVNGVETSFDHEQSVNDYILKADISGRFIVVVNGEVVPKSTYAITLLNTGDKLDIVSPVSGG